MVEEQMKRFSRLAGAMGALLAFGMGPAAAKEPLNLTPLPIEAIAQHPAMTSPSLSPDGKHIAALIPVDGQRWPAVAIWKTDDLSKPPLVVPSKVMRPVNVSFLGNSRVAFTADQPFTEGATKRFTRRSYLMDLNGQNFQELFQPKGAMSDTAREVARVFGSGFNILLDGSVQKPDVYVIERQNLETFNVEIGELNINTLEYRRVANAADDENVILVDPRNGEIMMKESLDAEGGKYFLNRSVKNRSTGQFERHQELSFELTTRMIMDPLGFYDRDPNKLYVSTNRGENFASIRIYDIATRTWEAEPAFKVAGFDATGMLGGVDPAAKEITDPIAFTYLGPASKTVYMDGYWAPLLRQIEQAFPGQQVTISNRRKRVDMALVTVSSAKNSPAYYLMRVNAGKPRLTLLGRNRPWIDPKTIGESTWVTYKARDGLEIPAILSLPLGYDKAKHGRIPVVVHPHGGPWARDFMGWDQSGWVPFMTTRGYAVLQPQYRGSNGLGEKLWKAGDMEWGQKMQDDKDDGGKWVVDQGIGDPNKMAIFGYSYGGFAAIAASVRPNSPYQCAIAGAGVSDLDRLGNLWGASRVQRAYQGRTVDGMNPIQNVDKANIPILLYHGDRDRQADTVHSRDFFRAMRGAGKDVQYVEIKDMWHQLPWWPEWHRESLGLIESYLTGPKCFGKPGSQASLQGPAQGD
jgi:dipeptidyl aminopeptidase/acylaminoacyl peptidase